MALFTTKTKTVDGIITSLTKIKKDLEIHKEEKNNELDYLYQDKEAIDVKIDYTFKERKRGDIIFKNITNLLGEKVED